MSITTAISNASAFRAQYNLPTKEEGLMHDCAGHCLMPAMGIYFPGYEGVSYYPPTNEGEAIAFINQDVIRGKRAPRCYYNYLADTYGKDTVDAYIDTVRANSHGLWDQLRSQLR